MGIKHGLLLIRLQSVGLIESIQFQLIGIFNWIEFFDCLDGLLLIGLSVEFFDRLDGLLLRLSVSLNEWIQLRSIGIFDWIEFFDLLDGYQVWSLVDAIGRFE